mgnify:CR=1 FL=1
MEFDAFSALQSVGSLHGLAVKSLLDSLKLPDAHLAALRSVLNGDTYVRERTKHWQPHGGACLCGAPQEDLEHLWWHCPRLARARLTAQGADLPALAGVLQYEVDDLLPLGEALQLLRFGILEEGDLILTEQGKAFANADVDERKRLFAEALRTHVPLVGMIRGVLDERWNHRASAVRFRDELEDHMSPDYADDTLRTVINWGRYAEIFSYDEEAEQFNLDDLE